MAERSLAPGPDTYQKIAHALNDALEDALTSIESYEEMMRIREWAERELRDRLRALDESGPYGWVVETDSESDSGEFETVDFVRSREAAVDLAPYPPHMTGRWRMVPVYAGPPEELDGD